jgi:hypothetical protein
MRTITGSGVQHPGHQHAPRGAAEYADGVQRRTPVSDREMGSIGRTFKDIGKRLASARPLRQQLVAVNDSVLAPYVNRFHHLRGLDTTYQDMIQTAFQPAWWQSNQIGRSIATSTARRTR